MVDTFCLCGEINLTRAGKHRGVYRETFVYVATRKQGIIINTYCVMYISGKNVHRAEAPAVITPKSLHWYNRGKPRDDDDPYIWIGGYIYNHRC